MSVSAQAITHTHARCAAANTATSKLPTAASKSQQWQDEYCTVATWYERKPNKPTDHYRLDVPGERLLRGEWGATATSRVRSIRIDVGHRETSTLPGRWTVTKKSSSVTKANGSWDWEEDKIRTCSFTFSSEPVSSFGRQDRVSLPDSIITIGTSTGSWEKYI